MTAGASSSSFLPWIYKGGPGYSDGANPFDPLKIDNYYDAWLHTVLPYLAKLHGYDFANLGFTGNVYEDITFDSNGDATINGQFFDFNQMAAISTQPDYIISDALKSYLDSRGFKIGVFPPNDGSGAYYGAILFPSGNPIPGTVIYVAGFNDAQFWTAAMLVVAFVSGGGLGVTVSPAAVVGQAVLGPTTAAAYPVVTSTLGNVAISAVTNGGDPEAAVKSAILNGVATGAGGFVQGAVMSATDVAIAAKLAGVAAKAYIYGGDVKAAVENAAIQLGAQSMDWTSIFSGTSTDTSTPTVDPASASFSDLVGNNTFAAIDPTAPAPAPTDSTSFASFNFLPTLDQTGAGGFDLASLFTSAPATADATAAPPAPPVALPSDAFTASQMIQTVTQASLAALSIVNAARGQTLQPIARSVSSGAVQSVSNDGLVHTQYTSGQTATSFPPVGKPIATIQGSIIVNNGNGTFTLVSPDGSTHSYQYPASGSVSASGSIVPNVSNAKLGILAAVAVGALFLLKK